MITATLASTTVTSTAASISSSLTTTATVAPSTSSQSTTSYLGSSTAASQSSGSSSSVGTYVGACIAGVVACILIIVIVIFVKRRKQDNRRPNELSRHYDHVVPIELNVLYDPTKNAQQTPTCVYEVSPSRHATVPLEPNALYESEPNVPLEVNIMYDSSDYAQFSVPLEPNVLYESGEQAAGMQFAHFYAAAGDLLEPDVVQQVSFYHSLQRETSQHDDVPPAQHQYAAADALLDLDTALQSHINARRENGIRYNDVDVPTYGTVHESEQALDQQIGLPSASYELQTLAPLPFYSVPMRSNAKTVGPTLILESYEQVDEAGYGFESYSETVDA